LYVFLAQFFRNPISCAGRFQGHGEEFSNQLTLFLVDHQKGAGFVCQANQHFVVVFHFSLHLLFLPATDPFVYRFFVEAPNPSDSDCWDFPLRCIFANGNLMEF
jgi:hypothetical protein